MHNTPNSNMTKKIAALSTTFACVASVATISILSLFTAGCEDASKVEGVAWNGSGPNVSADTTPTTTTGTTTDTGTGTTPVVDAYTDAVSYGSFNWVYGGFNGAGAPHSGVNISGLRYSGNTLFFNYVNDLSAWGLSNGDAGGALACFFVMNTAGQWVGGKFDWISSSRTSRGLQHCLTGYSGWSMSGIPNPCQAAFVIVSPNGDRRSNVLVGTWTR